MRVVYDDKADSAYLYLGRKVTPGGVDKTYCCDSGEVGGMINLDFDAEGRLIGIEVMDASTKLPFDALPDAV